MDKYLREAIDQYERNIESGKPFYMDANVLMDIEEYYEKSERPYDAERIMRFAERLHPDNEDVLIVKAYRLKQDGKWNEALSAVKSIKNQESRQVQLFLIEWDVASGRIDEALQRFNDNISILSLSEKEDWLYDIGEILLDYGYVERSIYYLKQLPNDYPMRRRVDELLGDAYCQLCRYDESIEALSQQVDADPYDSMSWAQLADVQFKDGRYQACIDSCEYALAIDDNNARAMVIKVYATFEQQKMDEGMQLYAEYSPKMPNDYTLHLYVGEQLVTNGRFREAVEPLQQALRLCPLDSTDRQRVVHALVCVSVYFGRLNDALELLFTLNSCGMQLVDLYVQFAETLIAYDKNDKAVDVLLRTVNLPDCSEKDYLSILHILYKNQIFEPAAKIWEKAATLSFSTNYYELYAYVAFAFYQLQHYQLFRESLQKAVNYCPQELCILFQPITHESKLSSCVVALFNNAVKWPREKSELEE